MKQNILVTGGAGYIGSHTCLELLNEGHNVVILDDLSNGSPEAIKRVAHLAEVASDRILFREGDVRDFDTVKRIINDGAVNSVIHFAGLKSVGESNEYPLRYYDVNVAGTINLLKVMSETRVHKLVFSSSATVYDSSNPTHVGDGGITEECNLAPINPYGVSKLMVEDILQDLATSDPSWSFTILRYFNPVGAHPSGIIGEDPHGIPNNLAPYITKVLTGSLKELTIHGDDYDTPDGTGVRDYIHVVDLAQAHVAALSKMSIGGANIFNVGTGKGTSVYELAKTFSHVSDKDIPCVVGPRRKGDVARCVADPSKIAATLGWRAKLTIFDMCRDAWVWQSGNPKGY